MTDKKADAEDPTRSGRSLASRLLGGAVPATLPAPSAEAPWRTRKPKRKTKGKRHK